MMRHTLQSNAPVIRRARSKPREQWGRGQGRPGYQCSIEGST